MSVARTRHRTWSRKSPEPLSEGHSAGFRLSGGLVAHKVRRLNEIARRRGQSLAQMAIAWVLRKPRVTSALVGVSRVEQLADNLAALEKLSFAEEELQAIETILKES